MPDKKTARYKTRWKNERHILGHRDLGDLKNKKSVDERPRFYHKDYVKKFAKVRSEYVLDLTHNLNNKLNPDGSTLKSNYVQFFDDTKDLDRFLEDGEVLDEPAEVGREFSTTSITIELNEIQTKTREFNTQLREEPNNEGLWLEYVAFQDIALGTTDFSKVKSAGNEEPQEQAAKKDKKAEKAGNVLLRNRAIIEKKLSILKTASEKNPHSILIAVERLKLSKEIYDNATLDRQWKELIFMFPGNVEVWKHYLIFNASHFTTFSVNKISKSYKNFFLKLKQMHSQGNQNFSGTSSQNYSMSQIEDEMVSLLVRQANLWTRAGYREKAIALFQATMELNLFSPAFPGSYSLEDRLATFEPFWESSVPRFGEVEAQGWATVILNKDKARMDDEHTDDNVAHDNNAIEDQLIETYLRGLENADKNEKEKGEDEDEEYDEKAGEPGLWLRMELEREKRHWAPWRSQGKADRSTRRSVTKIAKIRHNRSLILAICFIFRGRF